MSDTAHALWALVVVSLGSGAIALGFRAVREWYSEATLANAVEGMKDARELTEALKVETSKRLDELEDKFRGLAERTDPRLAGRR